MEKSIAIIALLSKTISVGFGVQIDLFGTDNPEDRRKPISWLVWLWP